MVLSRRLATFALVLVCLATAYAAGGRAALVIETNGENLLVSGETGIQVRTLQVLSDGSSVKVGSGAVLRLSFFKSGRKETITGPCTVELGPESSRQVAGTGKIEVQNARDSSTELDDSSNLRRKGGVMQANSTELVPESTLAFVYEGPDQPSITPVRYRNSDIGPTIETFFGPIRQLEFVGLSYAYLSPEEATTLQWNHNAERLVVYLVDGPTYAAFVKGKTELSIPAKYLIAGETHWAIIRSQESATEQFFRIFSPEEAQEYRELEKEIRDREADDPRSMYAELLYLNTELGLLSRARAVALQAVEEFPDDSGFQAALVQLNRKLRLP